jgi:hypothetical protein
VVEKEILRDSTSASNDRNESAAMNQISQDAAFDLLNKCLLEKIPVLAFFVERRGMRVRLEGFLDSATEELGLVFSVKTPPSKGPAFFSIPILGRECEYSYGEVREIPAEIRAQLREPLPGESALVVFFRDTGDWLAVFFTV